MHLHAVYRGAGLARKQGEHQDDAAHVRRAAAVKRAALPVALVAAAALGSGGAGAAAASVQVRVPADRVCTNTIGGIKLGVRWSGAGARRFGVRLYDPRGKAVLTRHGLATRAWKRWAYRPTLGGVYRTVYTLPGRTRRYRTASLGCGG
jgi:hypothetical protein